MTPKEESEKLMDSLLPLAKKMLTQYGEFYPYGGYMKSDGSIVDVGAQDPDTDHPRSKDVIYILRQTLLETANDHRCIATAIIFDVTVVPPNSDLKSDAIQVCLEHVEGLSAEVFFPYSIIDGILQYGETFAQVGKRDIF
jgi:hypothetical protein